MDKSASESRPRVLLVNRSAVLDSKGNVLLVQRAAGDRHNANLWEFPGGKLDEGQDVTQALEREVLEETGLLVMPVNRVAYFESRILTSYKYQGMPYIVLVGISKILGGKKVVLSEEHQNFAWVTPKEALTYDLTSETRKAILALENNLE